MVSILDYRCLQSISTSFSSVHSKQKPGTRPFIPLFLLNVSKLSYKLYFGVFLFPLRPFELIFPLPLQENLFLPRMVAKM